MSRARLTYGFVLSLALTSIVVGRIAEAPAVAGLGWIGLLFIAISTVTFWAIQNVR